MGCDIHVHIEHRDADSKYANDWKSFAFDGVYFSRSYELFALMANVRNSSGWDRDSIEPVLYPKGIPNDLSWATECSYFLGVDSKRVDHKSVSLESAQNWVDNGLSVIKSEESRKEVKEGDRVSCPDWHNASWMTLDELREVNKRYKYVHLELRATIAAMASLKRSGQDVRVVFYFDN